MDLYNRKTILIVCVVAVLLTLVMYFKTIFQKMVVVTGVPIEEPLPPRPETPIEELAMYTGHSPKAWGAQAWHMLHIVAINFPISNPSDDDILAITTYVSGMALTLPCGMCRTHFQEILKGEFEIKPTDLVDRLSIFAWTIRLHNHVNERLQKTQYTADLNNWFTYYTKMRDM